MRSIKNIFVIGRGPSSSHTMGPYNACGYILGKYRNIKHVDVVLTGSLAITGKGHFTDVAIHSRFDKIDHDLIFDKDTIYDHPNTLIFKVTTNEGVFIEKIISPGGGTIITEDYKQPDGDIYPHKSLKEILKYCDEKKFTLSDYVRHFEGDDIDEFAKERIKQWKKNILDGVKKDGYLPGPLHIERKSHYMFSNLMKQHSPRAKRNFDNIMVICAMACSEENASGSEIITAPTCGSCGVIPGCLAYLTADFTRLKDIINGILVAGLIGMICKTYGSISGAEAGCQAEIGVACAMGAALISAAKHLPNNKVVQAAEIALEHSLGLTCDPVGGYVVIPCIERNAMYAIKAKSAYTLAKLIPSETEVISFDDCLKTMVNTGNDLPVGYRETAKKGLAEIDINKNRN